MSHFDDDLKDFLKQNQPIAPEPKTDELKALLNRLDLNEPSINRSESVSRRKERASKKPRFLFAGSALAAGLAAIWMYAHPPFSPLVSKMKVGTEVAAIDEFSDEDDLTSDELPSIDVGEEYLGLIASKAD